MNKLRAVTALVVALVALAACSSEPPQHDQPGKHAKADGARNDKVTNKMEDSQETPAKTELATFGAGCFWCVEAVLEQLDGVIDVSSGFMGGTKKDPTYEDVCTGTTGHAEVVQVRFDPSKISYTTLLEWFWKLHDPTTLNRQGHDIGTQYRSVIFYHNDEQKRLAEKSKKLLSDAGTFHAPIVTEITKASAYYKAEGYHQDFYRNNKTYGYCVYNIVPKLEKLGLDK